MSITVAFCSNKGGVGKTTCATGFAALTAAAKEKTLLIDLDQEGHATFGLGAEVVVPEKTLGRKPVNHPGSADFLLGKGFPVQELSTYLHVLAGNSDLRNPDIARLEPESLLDSLEALKGQYDVIVIDCPPNAHELSKLGTVAANAVLIPTDAHPYAVNCAGRQIEELAARKARGRSGASRWAIVANRIDSRRKLDSEVMSAADTLFPDTPVFKISQDTLLSNSSTQRVPVTELATKHCRVMTELHALIAWAKQK